MSEQAEHNRARAIRWFQEVWNERLGTSIDEIMAPECRGNMEGVGDVDPVAFRATWSSMTGAFPDLSVEVLDTVAERSHVVVGWRMRATHTGDGLGIPATGREISVRGMTWFTFADGRIVEGWDSWNHGALVAELTGAAAV